MMHEVYLPYRMAMGYDILLNKLYSAKSFGGLNYHVHTCIYIDYGRVLSTVVTANPLTIL